MPNEILDQFSSPDSVDYAKRWRLNKILLGLATVLGVPNIIITNVYTPEQFSKIIECSRFQTTALVIGLIVIAAALALSNHANVSVVKKFQFELFVR